MLKIRSIGLIQRSYCQQIASRYNPIKEFNESKRNPKTNPLKYALYLIPLTTFGLGTWQVQRRKEKLEIIKLIDDRINAEPIELPKDLRDLKDMEYRKFIVKGKFDHSKEIIMQPRARIDNLGQGSGGLFSGRSLQNGAWIITPLKLSDRNFSILVNRGWVPKHKIAQNNRKSSLIQNEVTLTGVLRLTEKRTQFSMKNKPENDFWNYRDVELMARTRNSAPVFLDATKESTMKGGPIGGQTRISIRNEHINYIITWYSLSLLTFLLTRKALAL